MKKLLLLALVMLGGVMQVSAWTTVKLLNSLENNWGADATTVMTKINDGSDNYFYYILDSSQLTDKNYYFRIYVTDDTKYYGAWFNDAEIYDVVNYGGCEGTNSFKLVTDQSSKYIINIGYWDDLWHFTVTDFIGTGTITFVNTGNYSNPKAWVYCAGEARLVGGGGWPGRSFDTNEDGTLSLKNINLGKNSHIIITDDGDDATKIELDLTGDVVIDGSGAVANQTVTVSKYGMSTFCSQYPLDFSTASPADLKAYKITESNKATGALTKVEVTKVPANVGVYIEGASGESSTDYTVSTTATATSIGDNMLVGVTAATKIYQEDDDYTNYILTINKAGGNVATPKFFKVNSAGNDVSANRAYLQIPTANAAREFFWFDDEETTEIQSVKDTNKVMDNCFDLQGRRISQPTKGLYIVNGKKVAFK